ncbi:MAG: exodeoxyribonuclease VII small subunit [Bacilli bacterium]|nr:exodeoxyribonuclease VII small subunit [Bacilli bacterium]
MKDKKFEELMNELEIIVKELENGEIDLEKSIEKYTEAMKLVKVCGDKLNKAVISVNKVLAENGNFEDFKIEDNQ